MDRSEIKKWPEGSDADGDGIPKERDKRRKSLGWSPPKKGAAKKAGTKKKAAAKKKAPAKKAGSKKAPAKKKGRSRPPAMNTDPAVGMAVGGETINTEGRRQAINSVTDAVKARGSKGQAVAKILFTEGPGSLERLLHEHGLTGLAPRDRMRLTLWLIANVDPNNDTVGRQGRRGKRNPRLPGELRDAIEGADPNRPPSPKEAARWIRSMRRKGLDVPDPEDLSDDEKIALAQELGYYRKQPQGDVEVIRNPGLGQAGVVEREYGDLPKEQKTQRQPRRLGRIKASVVQTAVKELGLGTKASARRRPLSEQEIVNPQGPKRPHGDPTAQRALRGQPDAVPDAQLGRTPEDDTAARRRVRERMADRSLRTGGERELDQAIREAEAAQEPDPQQIRNAIAAREIEEKKGQPRKRPAKKAPTKKKASAKKAPAKKQPSSKAKAAAKKVAAKKRGAKKGPIEKGLISNLLRVARARDVRAKFDETKHKRDAKGRFARKGGPGPGLGVNPRMPAGPTSPFDRAKAAKTGSGKPKGFKAPPKPKKAAAKKAPTKKKAAPKKKAPAKKTPAKKKAATKAERPVPEMPERSTQPAPIARIDEMLKDLDGFDSLEEAIDNGEIKRKTKLSGAKKTYASSELIEVDGETRFVKKTSYKRKADVTEEVKHMAGDVHTDGVVSELMDRLGVRSQRFAGFVGITSDDADAATVIMRDIKEQTNGNDPQKPVPFERLGERQYADRTEFTKMMVADYLVANHDRHLNNWVEYEDEDGWHIVAIDHSMSGGPAARAGRMNIWLEDGEHQGVEDFMDDYDSGELQPAELNVSLAASRSFGAHVEDGFDEKDTVNHSANMPSRVYALYNGDMDALRADLERIVADMSEVDVNSFIGQFADDNGMNTNEVFDPMEDLAVIWNGRMDYAANNIDDIVQTVERIGGAYMGSKSSQRMVRDEALKRRKDLAL